ncbi:MAG: hypothetical protein ACRDYA_14330 [Egibacteraceae bacterium]
MSDLHPQDQSRDHDGFVRFLDEVRADEVARARSRERWLWQQTTEEARFAGTLVDLLERGAPVNVRTTTGRMHHGTFAAVGLDFCVLRTSTGVDRYLALSALGWVRPVERAGPPATGDRPAPLDLRLAECFGHLVDDRPRMLIFVRGDAEPIAGELRAVGVDVVTLRVDGAERGVCFVPTTAIVEAVVARD